MEPQLSSTNSFMSNTCNDFACSSHDLSNSGRVEAGFRISSFLMTKAWRKRLNDCNGLVSVVNSLANETHIAQEEFEMKKARFNQKQRENEDLTCQLHMTQNEIEKLRNSIEELAPAVSTLELKKTALMSQFNKKSNECIETNMRISDLKLKLLESSERNKQLAAEIEIDHAKAEQINEQGNKLVDAIAEMTARDEANEAEMQRKIDEVENEIQEAKYKKKELKIQLAELNRFCNQIENAKPNNSGTSVELEKALLRQQANILQEALDKTFESKLRRHGLFLLSIIMRALKVLLPAFPAIISNHDCSIAKIKLVANSNESDC